MGERGRKSTTILGLIEAELQITANSSKCKQGNGSQDPRWLLLVNTQWCRERLCPRNQSFPTHKGSLCRGKQAVRGPKKTGAARFLFSSLLRCCEG